VTSEQVPRWVETLVSRIGASSLFCPTVFVVDPTDQREKPFLFRLYERVDAALFNVSFDAAAPVSLGPPAPRPLEELDTCDVVLDLGSRKPDVLAESARYGAWTVRRGTGDPSLFWETYCREVFVLELEVHTSSGERRLLYRSAGATDALSPRRSRSAASWTAQEAIFRSLTALATQGPAYLGSRATPVASERRAAPKNTGRAMLHHTARAFVAALGRRGRRALYEDEWFIATRPRVASGALDELTSSSKPPFVPLATPPGVSLADPFPFEKDGQTYLFCEETLAPDPKGFISYVRLDGNGRPIGATEKALDRPYHLSYPFVFRRDGVIYMIPESADNRTVELYRATRFPDEWTLERVIIDDLLAVDATLLEQPGHLWLFMTLAGMGAPATEELHVYHAKSVIGPWEPHRKNPVIADVRSARPAGRIFRHDDQLVRPAQDCSRAYGGAIVFNRIDVLTEKEYRETEIARVDPIWLPKLTGTHTYNFTGTVEALDGRRYALKPRLGSVPSLRWHRR
jgi:hypothetical protein